MKRGLSRSDELLTDLLREGEMKEASIIAAHDAPGRDHRA
jgi:hypothetical protein